jgi:hypothetical protein
MDVHRDGRRLRHRVVFARASMEAKVRAWLVRDGVPRSAQSVMFPEADRYAIYWSCAGAHCAAS